MRRYVGPKGGLDRNALKKKRDMSTSTGDEEVEVLIPSHCDDSTMNEDTEAAPRPPKISRALSRDHMHTICSTTQRFPISRTS